MPDKLLKRRVIVNVDDEEDLRTNREVWMQHVLSNIERLASDLYSSKDDFTNRLSKVKDDQYQLKDSLKEYVDSGIDKLRRDLKEDLNTLQGSLKTLSDAINKVEGRLNSTEIKRISEAKASAESVESKIAALAKEIDSKMERRLSPMAKEIWFSKGKIVVWTTILGLLIAAIITYAVRHL